MRMGCAFLFFLLTHQVSEKYISITTTQMSSCYDEMIKVIIVGDSGVGKSSLLYRFTDKDWNPHYCSTSVGLEYKTVYMNSRWSRVALQLWDTVGQERFRTVIPAYYRGAHGIILAYDVTNLKSFENVMYWVDDVRQRSITDHSFVLVACKTDLVTERVVPHEAGAGLAKTLQCKHFETSSRDNISVDEGFQYIVDVCFSRVRNDGAGPPKQRISLEHDNFYRHDSSGFCMCGSSRQGVK
jgi:small GTP-binding protein